MGNKTQPWFGAARRLSERRTDGYGLAVDRDGVTLGPDFPLIRKTSRGYETVTLEELSCLREVVSLGTGDTQRLVRHLESIAKALNAEDFARARILGLYFPINRLTRDQSERVRKAAALMKRNFDPGEPRDERGRWTSGTATSSASAGVQTRAGARLPFATHPGVMRVQELLIEPEVVPEIGEFPFEEDLPRIEEKPPPVKEPPAPQIKEVPPPAKEVPPATDEEPFKPSRLPNRGLTREQCNDAAERSTRQNPGPWENVCRQVSEEWKRECWKATYESVQYKKGICSGMYPMEMTANVQY